MTSFNDLWSEFTGPDAFGPELYRLLLDVTASVARRKEARRYAGQAAWDDEAIRDLAHEVAAKRLLTGQLAYAMQVAAQTPGREVDVLRGLIGQQVRNQLIDRYRTTFGRSLIDNVVDDLNRLLKADLQADDGRYERGARPDSYRSRRRRSDAPTDPGRPPGDAALRRAAEAVRVVPRRLPRAGKRNRSIYRSDDLDLILEIVTRELADVTVKEIREILDLVLTPWLPASIDVDVSTEAAPFDDPSDVVESSDTERAAARDIVGSLSVDQCRHLLLVLEGWKDGPVGERLGISRTAALARRQAIEREVLRRLDDVDLAATRRIFDEVRRQLIRGEDV